MKSTFKLTKLNKTKKTAMASMHGNTVGLVDFSTIPGRPTIHLSPAISVTFNDKESMGKAISALY